MSHQTVYCYYYRLILTGSLISSGFQNTYLFQVHVYVITNCSKQHIIYTKSLPSLLPSPPLSAIPASVSLTLLLASRDSSMALWSVDSSERNKNSLAEEVAKIEPIFQFSNVTSHSHRRTTSGERVRSLAYDKHNYVCTS